MEPIKRFLRNKDKKVIQNLLIALAAGIALLVVSQTLLTPAADAEVPADAVSGTVGINPAQSTAMSLESRMEEVLSLMDNAGRVRVLINYSQGAETVVARNETTDASDTAERDTSGGIRDQASEKIQSSVVTLRGSDGGDTPLVLYENAPKVEGVIIVAEGGGDVIVIDALVRAASALLGIPVHKVTVLKMAALK